MSNASNGGGMRTQVDAKLAEVERYLRQQRERLHDPWVWAILGPVHYGAILDGFTEAEEALASARQEVKSGI